MRAQTVSRMCRNFRSALSFCWEVPGQDELVPCECRIFSKACSVYSRALPNQKTFDVFGELSFNHLCKVTIDINIHHEKL
jgi:hypothetical protein